jgi:predicted helicase
VTRLTRSGTPRRAAPRRLPSMRPYQEEVHDAIVTGLTNGNWGQLHAACGSGKTFMALRAVEELVPGDGTIVVLAPSLALVAQILREWQDASMVDFRAMAVCSDEKVSDVPSAHRAAGYAPSRGSSPDDRQPGFLDRVATPGGGLPCPANQPVIP